jgi:3-oxoacyl-[acyl-carrier-protein] synthase III
MLTRVEGVRVAGIAGAVPRKIVRNIDIGGPDDVEYVERISSMVGVTERRSAQPDEFVSDLGVAAAQALLTELQWDPADIDLLVVLTQTPDLMFPATACLVHARLSLPMTCAAFDVNLGCSAYPYGLWIASSIMSGRRGAKAIVITGDTMTKLLDGDDLGNRVLFGDGAAATALEQDDRPSAAWYALATDGSGAGAVSVPNSGLRHTRYRVGSSNVRGARVGDFAPPPPDTFVLNGVAVLGFSLKRAPQIVKELLEGSGVDPHSVTALVPHQANTFILEKLGSRWPVPEDRQLIAMEHLGNTSSASIPLAMVAKRERFSGPGDETVVVAGFGTGLSWGAGILHLSDVTIPALVEL